jgi:hypothetical protein
MRIKLKNKFLSLNNMKIAVLIYGRLNKSDERYCDIMNSLNNYDDIDFFCSSDNSDDDTLRYFINKYKPISYINDKINIDDFFEFFSNFPILDPIPIENMIPHFINKKRVYDLFLKHAEENNKQYDIIMYLRNDLELYDKFNFEYPKDNNIYIPSGSDHQGGINDQIAYGNKDVMKIYSELISNSKKLFSDNIVSVVHPETILKAYLTNYNLIINRFTLSYIINKNFKQEAEVPSL